MLKSWFNKFINKYFDIPVNFYRKENTYLIIATLGGCGYFKKAPGTLASFITLIFVLLISQINNSLLIPITIFLLLVGFFVCEKIYTPLNPDASYVVIDEVVGQSLALLLVSHHIGLSFLAFVIFRILDIKKPWIIKISESTFKGGAGIMIDDIIAGFATLLIITGIAVIIN
ncbi:Phosphatidylglycerophosphatase A [Candidatus Hepatincolaceae symbiont of Richtersius coronifer]